MQEFYYYDKYKVKNNIIKYILIIILLISILIIDNTNKSGIVLVPLLALAIIAVGLFYTLIQYIKETKIENYVVKITKEGMKARELGKLEEKFISWDKIESVYQDEKNPKEIIIHYYDDFIEKKNEKNTLVIENLLKEDINILYKKINKYSNKE